MCVCVYILECIFLILIRDKALQVVAKGVKYILLLDHTTYQKVKGHSHKNSGVRIESSMTAVECKNDSGPWLAPLSSVTPYFDVAKVPSNILFFDDVPCSAEFWRDKNFMD